MTSYTSVGCWCGHFVWGTLCILTQAGRSRLQCSPSVKKHKINPQWKAETHCETKSSFKLLLSLTVIVAHKQGCCWKAWLLHSLYLKDTVMNNSSPIWQKGLSHNRDPKLAPPTPSMLHVEPWFIYFWLGLYSYILNPLGYDPSIKWFYGLGQATILQCQSDLVSSIDLVPPISNH